MGAMDCGLDGSRARRIKISTIHDGCGRVRTLIAYMHSKKKCDRRSLEAFSSVVRSMAVCGHQREMFSLQVIEGWRDLCGVRRVCGEAT
jgi:hypothetical protein